MNLIFLFIGCYNKSQNRMLILSKVIKLSFINIFFKYYF